MAEPCEGCITRIAVLEVEMQAVRRETALAHTAHANLHSAALIVAEKDAELMRDRLHQMNLFREEGRKAQETYVRSDIHDAQYKSLTDRVLINTARLDKFSGVWMIAPAMTFLIGLTSLAVTIIVVLAR